MAEIPNLLEKVVSLCKRRGFIFQNSEIYGGIQGFYDYGPVGVELKNNIKRLWWKWMIQGHDNIIGIDGAVITHPKVWEASGHIQNFVDPLVECKKCHHRFKQDDLEEKVCPDCKGELTNPKNFNILVPAELGIIEGAKQTVYLRGEACQNIYLNFDNILKSTNKKIPFGIIQIGKAFRNEITPGHFLYRQKEFEQWDLQWFTKEKDSPKWFNYWKEERMKWYLSLIGNKEKIRFKKHDKLAHYAKDAYDIEYNTPFGWKEWEGIHLRGDWDLSRHQEFSKKDLTYFDQETGKKFIPWVVETSGGVDRTFLYLLLDAYEEEKIKDDTRVVLKIKKELAPYKIAVFPLVANKEEIKKKARSIYELLKNDLMTVWDDIGNIGKRYRRQDEIGTPWCVTIDYDTLENDTVTIRDRDTMEQIRLKEDKLLEYFQNNLRR